MVKKAIEVKAEPIPKSAMHIIPLSEIMPSPTNPRKHFNPEKLAELADSIKKHGVLQPILVRPNPHGPNFELVAGERRYRASIAAGMPDIPGFIRALDDLEVLEVQVIENLQRDDLHPLEEAEGYEKLMQEHCYTAELLADKIGKSKAYIYARLKLCALCSAVRLEFYNGMNASIALLIARIPVPKLQIQAMNEIMKPLYSDGPMSYRRAADHVQSKYMLQLDKAAFDITDENLILNAGPCRDCPKMAANQPEIFSDLKNADVCTDPECFAEKRQAGIDLRIADATSSGKAVIRGEQAKKALPDLYMAPAKWLRLDKNNWHDGKNRTYGQILGKSTPTITLIEDVQNGCLVECVLVEDAKAAGLKFHESGSSGDKEREKEARQETLFRSKLHEACRLKFAADLDDRSLPLFPTLSPREMSVVAQTFFYYLDFETKKRLVKIWNPGTVQHDEVRAFAEQISSMDEGEICRLLIDLTVIGQVHIGPYSSSQPTELMALANQLGVNPDQIRREVLAGAKAKPKAAPATKKASSKPHLAEAAA